MSSDEEWSINGFKSLKIQKINNSYYSCNTKYEQSIPSKTITLTGVIKSSKNNTASIYLIEQLNSQTVAQQSINIPKNTEQEFSISLISSNDNDLFVIQFASYDDVGTEIFIDNLNLSVQ